MIKKNIHPYRLTWDEDEWAVVAAEDKEVAVECFLEDFKMSEKEYDRLGINIEKVSPGLKVLTPYFPKPISVGALIEIIKFFPRVLAESGDLVQ